MLTAQLRDIIITDKKKFDKRVIELLICTFVLVLIVVSGIIMWTDSNNVDFSNNGSSPSSIFVFGTDWLGRDIFRRTMSGLMISLICALASTAISTIIATVMAFLQTSNNSIIESISRAICDCICGVPQIVLLLIVSIALNKGYAGVIAGISLTHWATLSRILAGEIGEIKRQPWSIFAHINYSISKRVRLTIPELVPQIVVGATLFFPHAILHESTLTFLGFGLSSETPAIGIILSEASTHLAQGMWWVAIFPGCALILTTLLVKRIADITKSLYGIS